MYLCIQFKKKTGGNEDNMQVDEKGAFEFAIL